MTHTSYPKAKNLLGNMYLITEESFPKDFFKVDWRKVCIRLSPTTARDDNE